MKFSKSILALSAATLLAASPSFAKETAAIGKGSSLKEVVAYLKTTAKDQCSKGLSAEELAALVKAYSENKVPVDLLITGIQEVCGSSTATGDAANALLKAGASTDEVTAAAIVAGVDPTTLLGPTAAGPANANAFSNANSRATNNAPGFVGRTPTGTPVPGGGGGGRPASQS